MAIELQFEQRNVVAFFMVDMHGLNEDILMLSDALGWMCR